MDALDWKAQTKRFKKPGKFEAPQAPHQVKNKKGNTPLRQTQTTRLALVRQNYWHDYKKCEGKYLTLNSYWG